MSIRICQFVNLLPTVKMDDCGIYFDDQVLPFEEMEKNDSDEVVRVPIDQVDSVSETNPKPPEAISNLKQDPCVEIIKLMMPRYRHIHHKEYGI